MPTHQTPRHGPAPDIHGQTNGPRPASRSRDRRVLPLALALVTLVAVGCGLQDVAAAGTALEDAGYEAHELRLEEGGLVTAELERSGEPIEDAHFEQAAAIIWENMDDTVVESEIRMRDPDGSDRVENYTADEMRRFSDEG